MEPRGAKTRSRSHKMAQDSAEEPPRRPKQGYGVTLGLQNGGPNPPKIGQNSSWTPPWAPLGVQMCPRRCQDRQNVIKDMAYPNFLTKMILKTLQTDKHIAIHYHTKYLVVCMLAGSSQYASKPPRQASKPAKPPRQQASTTTTPASQQTSKGGRRQRA